MNRPNLPRLAAFSLGILILNSAWLTGPHPAALAEIEVAEEIGILNIYDEVRLRVQSARIRIPA